MGHDREIGVNAHVPSVPLSMDQGAFMDQGAQSGLHLNHVLVSAGLVFLRVLLAGRL